LAIGTGAARVAAEHHRHGGLPSERHLIESVRPPYIGSYIINGALLTAKSGVCTGWAAGDRATLLAGDWQGRCVDAVFRNAARHRSCQMWCS
jgi:hypothetical protein